VVKVVSVSLHHQQCDKFRKIRQENTKWTGAIICMWCFIVLLPPGARMSTSKWMVFGSVDLGHSEKHPFLQRHLKKMNWSLNLLMLGSLVAGVIPLACLQDLPRPQSCCHSWPLLRNLLSQTRSHIQLGTGTWLSYGHSLQTAYWETNSQSGIFYAFETDGHIVKSHIFQLSVPWLFTYQSVYLYISDLSWNYNPEWSLPKKHLDFSLCVGQKRTINSSANNKLYLFVWQWYAVSLSSFFQTFLL
jgi:hypothetical protein